MYTDLTRFGLNSEIVPWLERLGYQQAIHVLTCIVKLLKFAKKRRDFFQGCGLYAAGSSVTDGPFNDVDLVLVGFDFRAVVAYDKIFLMEPETLIEKGILVEPRLFVETKESEGGRWSVVEPVTEVKNPDPHTDSEVRSRMGLVHKGVRYDYNIERYLLFGMYLASFCSYHADPSELTTEIRELLSSPSKPESWDDDLDPDRSFCNPFEYYGLGGQKKFLVYRFPVEAKHDDLPGAEGAVLQEVRPVDFHIHVENLYAREWERHQKFLGLPYLTLKEWPVTRQTREIITKLDYPRFIDPSGVERARPDPMFDSYEPDKTPDCIDQE